MADTTKKKPDPYNPMAALPGGMQAGMATLQQTTPQPTPPTGGAPIAPRTAGPHSPVQPGLKPTNAAAAAAAAPPAPSAFEAGQLTRTGLKVAPGIPGLLAESTGIPGAMRSAGASLGSSISGFSRGMAGMDPAAAPSAPTPAPAATPAAALASAVVPPAAAAPAPVAAAPVPAAVPAAPPVPVAATQAPAPQPAPVAPTLKPGDVNTFTGSNGVARAVPGMQTAPAAPMNVPAAAPAVVQAPQATLRPSGGSQGAVIGGDPNEERRRQEIALASATSGTARSRGARAQQAAMVQGINEQFGQRRGIEAQAANAQLDANTKTGIAGQEVASRLAQGNADRIQRAGEFGVSSTLQRDQFNAERTGIRSAMTSEDGTASLLRNDGSMTPITGADGKPFREMNNSGNITDSDLFKAYSNEAKGISENALLKPEQQAAQLAALQQRPEYAGVLQKVGVGNQAPGGVTPAHIAFLKANPDKAAEFDAKFGQGSSATYLSP